MYFTSCTCWFTAYRLQYLLGKKGIPVVLGIIGSPEVLERGGPLFLAGFRQGVFFLSRARVSRLEFDWLLPLGAGQAMSLRFRFVNASKILMN